MSGLIQVAAILIAAVALSAGGFLGFRSIARLLVQREATRSERALQSGALAPGAFIVPEPPPSRDAVIAEALAWEPPLVSGKPTPLDRAAALPIKSGDHVLGSHLAPITLVLFGDLQCRHAAHSLQSLIRRVQEQPGEYRLVWRERPLGAGASAMATDAERLSLQQGEAAFWRYVSALSRLNGSATPSDAAAIARALQSQSPKLSDTAATEQALKQVRSDEQIAAAYFVRESPTLFLNGLRLDGDVAEVELDELIEEEIDAIEELEQDSVPRAKIYAARVHQNLLELELD